MADTNDSDSRDRNPEPVVPELPPDRRCWYCRSRMGTAHQPDCPRTSSVVLPTETVAPRKPTVSEIRLRARLHRTGRA